MRILAIVLNVVFILLLLILSAFEEMNGAGDWMIFILLILFAGLNIIVISVGSPQGWISLWLERKKAEEIEKTRRIRERLQDETNE